MTKSRSTRPIDACRTSQAPGTAAPQAAIPPARALRGHRRRHQQARRRLGVGRFPQPALRQDLGGLRPREGDPAFFHAEQSGVRDRHTVGVAGKVLEHSVCVTERRLGGDHPVFLVQRCQVQMEFRGRQVCRETPGVPRSAFFARDVVAHFPDALANQVTD